MGDKPYAIEVSYGSDGKHMYFRSRPNGKMAQCIGENQNIIFKVCDADKFYYMWRAISVFGKADRLTRREDILYGMKMIAEKLIHTTRRINRTEEQLKAIGEILPANPEAGGPLRIAIENFSGVTSLPFLDMSRESAGT